eukprot:2451756-Alexandrium_andersonii.AAC.1
MSSPSSQKPPLRPGKTSRRARCQSLFLGSLAMPRKSVRGLRHERVDRNIERVEAAIAIHEVGAVVRHSLLGIALHALPRTPWLHTV